MSAKKTLEAANQTFLEKGDGCVNVAGSLRQREITCRLTQSCPSMVLRYCRPRRDS